MANSEYIYMGISRPVGWWLVGGLYYPIFIGNYSNPRTGNAYKPSRIKWILSGLPSGKLTVCYGKWAIEIVDFPIKYCDFCIAFCMFTKGYWIGLLWKLWMMLILWCLLMVYYGPYGVIHDPMNPMFFFLN